MVLKLSQITNAPSAPAATDKIVGVGAGNNDYLYSIAQLASAIVSLSAPQGRLTLQSGAPVQTADQVAKSTVYYDSYVGNLVPVWNGSIWVPLAITSDEVSFGLATANVLSGSVYDIFAVNSSGSLALVVGPAWSSTSARGTGAGTTELQRLSGIWTNKNSLTHAYGGAAGTTDYGTVSANQATYLGSLYATANGQTGVALKPAGANGGSNNIVGLFNAYNRIRVTALNIDTTTTPYNYGSTTWRPLNNSNNNRISFLDGLGYLHVVGRTQFYVVYSSGSPNANGGVGVNFNSTSTTPNVVASFATATSSSSTQGVPIAIEGFYPLLGFNYVQAMEAVFSGTAQINLRNSSPVIQWQATELDLMI
jgi:hypothetical protein